MTGLIGIGFADTKHKTRTYPLQNIFKLFNDGKCLVGLKVLENNHNCRFKEGDTVETHLKRNDMMIEWIVGSQVIYRIKDSKINWVPFVQIGNVGDIVEIYTR